MAQWLISWLSTTNLKFEVMIFHTLLKSKALFTRDFPITEVNVLHCCRLLLPWASYWMMFLMPLLDDTGAILPVVRLYLQPTHFEGSMRSSGNPFSSCLENLPHLQFGHQLSYFSRFVTPDVIWHLQFCSQEISLSCSIMSHPISCLLLSSVVSVSSTFWRVTTWS